MAERLTRGEHIERAAELADAAYAFHVDLVKAGEILKENPGKLFIAQLVTELTQAAAASNARIQSLATLATAHVKLAEALGEDAGPKRNGTATYFGIEYDLDAQYQDRDHCCWMFVGTAIAPAGLPIMARTGDTDEGRVTEYTDLYSLPRVLDLFGWLSRIEAAE